MADVMDLPIGAVSREDRRKNRSVNIKERGSERKERRADSEERMEERVEERVAEKQRRETEIRESRDRREERVRREETEDGPSHRDHHERSSGRQREHGDAAMTLEKKERERDRKRRRSLSPPPYPQRVRDRYLPPTRRSPPYKRARREDEYENARRGDSFGGPASYRDGLKRASGPPADQRFRHAYDVMGFNERAGFLGGRRSSTYSGDNQFLYHHSAPGGYHDGPPDWSGSGRTGFSDGPPVSSNVDGLSGRREGLMTYKQFIAELEDDILPVEAERRYEEYKSEFISTQKLAFFEQRKDDDWLREKYDPSHLEAVLTRRFEDAKAASEDFLAALEAGICDLSPNANGREKTRVNSDTHPLDEDTDVPGKRRKSVKNSATEKVLDAAPMAPAISSEPKRVSKDIQQVQVLIRKLDSEKGIGPNVLTSSVKQNIDISVSDGSLGPIVIVRGENRVKGLEGLELLDAMLSYLWRVHGLDYYGMIELKEPPNGLRHVRTEGKTGEKMMTASAADWEEKLDSTWQSRLKSEDPVKAMLGREKMESAAVEALDPLVRKIKDDKYGWKYGCASKGCSKLFHGPEYVHKHLKLKHPEMVNEIISKAREELYRQNYMNDPNAPGSEVRLVSHARQKDRGRKRIAGVPGSSVGNPEVFADRPMPDRGFAEYGPSSIRQRLLHDGDHVRGLVRDHERHKKLTQDEEMLDRVERSPGRDEVPPSSGGPGPSYEGIAPASPNEGPLEPRNFDPFNRLTMRGPPFVDVHPPPVLMPVPGAGPLGPFVPAPPEVALRMWREQGGHPPFHPGALDGGFGSENNGGSRGGRGSYGHGIGPGMVDGPPTMLPVPRAPRHDPRHVRSYHDLDAPEDEVTVSDYRSL